MELVPETAFRPHALNPTLLNNTRGIVTEAPGMPQYGDLIAVNSLYLGHTVNPALLHAMASTDTVTANPSSCLKEDNNWRMLTKDCENVPAEVKVKSPGHVINAIELLRCNRVYSNSRATFTDPRSHSEQTYKASQGPNGEYCCSWLACSRTFLTSKKLR
ncbi:hypothetical protein FOXYSP1_20388 [Fusarium oxysporum f. sp. phaseoli]